MRRNSVLARCPEMSPGSLAGNAMHLHTEITNRIIAELEQGTAPWVKPWAVPLPYNATTQRRYTGVNVLLLWDAPYPRPAWLTFRQAALLGGHVRKGEHATPIVYVSKFVKGDGDDEKVIPFLRRYYVFNVEQTEGLPDHLYARPHAASPERITEFFGSNQAEVRHGGGAAYYDRTNDYIQLPHQEHFTSVEQYYATRLHETVHWTGHPARLNRQFGQRFGDQAYAFEELVAELGSAFLAAELGLTPELHHAEYVGHWVKVLRDHRSAIFTAAARATEAFNYLCNVPESPDAAVEDASAA
jgi:antirestriction protein ArdC